jgi:hypothetical protein
MLVKSIMSVKQCVDVNQTRSPTLVSCVPVSQKINSSKILRWMKEEPVSSMMHGDSLLTHIKESRQVA